MPPVGERPFVLLNMAMTADGKIAAANRDLGSFGSDLDQQHLLELRSTADAIMAGARTVDLNPVQLGPGPLRFRRLRLRQGLREYPLRIVVSGSGSLNPQAEIFRHRYSPILVLTTARIRPADAARLREVADEVRICGRERIDFLETLRWLRQARGVRRLLVEGGGELNATLFRANLIDELHLTVCPVIFGGTQAPTLADGRGFARLNQAVSLKRMSMRRRGAEVFLIFRRSQ
ncbi:MAG TPA: RibD family protein [Candidatus Paceibacterota bacterium]|nr:RibD family protein [Verrucomicrobiota bacterium]HRY47326.1 RibD family protein [Candidatus Paceibacterota bacterium]HSA01832.1 RibD family protein [Candidatus Paceibacterota bacterium]